MEVKRHYLISDILHVRSFFEIVLNGLLSIIGAVLGYFHLLVISESKLFIAVGIIVGIDWLSGMYNAYINDKFETNKAKKVVFYLIAYWFIGAGCIILSQTFVSAFWVTEAIMFPLLFSQLLSAVKNANLSGIIKSEALRKILENIDKHKN